MVQPQRFMPPAHAVETAGLRGRERTAAQGDTHAQDVACGIGEVRIESERCASNRNGDVVAAPKGWIPATVLSRNGAAGARNFLRIGKGSRDGVVKGASVSSPDGLVGIVDVVSPHTCTVKLITDPSVKVSCVLETGDPALGAVFGIVSGTGATKLSETKATVLYVVNPLRLGHLKNGFAPAPRTRVYTSGLGGVFPKGILVGYLISDVRSDATKLEMESDVAPAVDFPALEEVFIRNEG